ncbi:MAG: endopeptidase La [Oscillochloris sp.]|nr:endopeptidase La [Oscillochloris sp.]
MFPRMLAPLYVAEERAIRAIEAASDRLVLAVAQRDAIGEGPFADLYSVGVEAVVQRVRKLPDGSLSVVLEGRRRMRVMELLSPHPALIVQAMPLYSDGERTIAVEAMMRAVLSLYERVVRLSRTLPDDAYVTAMNVDDPGGLADLIASTLPIPLASRQQVLETIDPEERLHRVSALLTQELDVLELEGRIQSQVQREVDRSQREFFLREQLKVIQRELGQDDPAQRELKLIRERLEAAGLPALARARADEEIGRLEQLSPLTPEHAVVRNYLDWLVALPWTQNSADNADLRLAAKVLEQNHYGLGKVKDRILEFIAVRQLAGAHMKAPILCFVGPPGVGKTSLGQSIAEALGRKFVRLSLGGVHDEAEIRGHRRTYIGAMPGRILQRMKTAGTINPVFMLDEVDKIGADFRGDPTAALLEVLDPEQNFSFSDHYLDLGYDLSQVMFITTANIADDIPDALLDRMEVIEISGYTEEEKLQIARRFLIPRQFSANGLPPTTLTVTTPALQAIVRGYTYESGVRGLERAIGSICRKTARRIAEGRSTHRRITPRLVERMLGPPRFEIGRTQEQDQVGVVTGLAYTGAGGDVMPIEVSLMEGKGGLTLTGHLGEVMQESAQAALSYARSNAATLGIDAKRFEKLDIHVHVPEGATPKDGPSGGVAMAIALISALTGREARRDVAITGELTLRGRLLAVGGIKEKVLGAYRAGIKTVIMPEKNRHDLVEIPAQIRGRLQIILADRIEQVQEQVLAPQPPAPERRNARKVITKAK